MRVEVADHDPAHIARGIAASLALELGRLQEHYGDDSASGPMPAEWRVQVRRGR